MATAYYFDTSALLKKYFFEKGTERVKKILRSENRLFTSTLTYPEMHAGLRRAYRHGFVAKRDFIYWQQDFAVDWLSFGTIDVVEEVCALVPKLLEKFPLRGADVVHMASFVTLINGGIDAIFVASDKILLNAIEDFGGRWLDPEEN